MAFDIVLQKNISEAERVDKELVTLVTATGILKDGCSIVDPVVLIACDLSAVVQCNYATISSFGRSYFVNNITSVKNGLVSFEMHCDVLSTYKTQIRDNRAIIKRQANDWNLYLNDGSLKVYQNPIVLTAPFPSGFSGLNPEFVLAVAGSGSSNNREENLNEHPAE